MSTLSRYVRTELKTAPAYEKLPFHEETKRRPDRLRRLDPARRFARLRAVRRDAPAARDACAADHRREQRRDDANDFGAHGPARRHLRAARRRRLDGARLLALPAEAVRRGP